MQCEGIVMLEGEEYPPIPHGSEEASSVGPCHIYDPGLGGRHEMSCPLGAGQLHQCPQHRRDCGVSIGLHHVINCVIESCLRYGGQHSSCACNGSEDAPN